MSHRIYVCIAILLSIAGGAAPLAAEQLGDDPKEGHEEKKLQDTQDSSVSQPKSRSLVAEEAVRIKWNRFQLAGHAAFTILPPEAMRQEPLPWVMYAPTFDRQLPNERDEGWMMRRFLRAGIAIAGVDVGESYGSPAGREVYNRLHKHLTTSKPTFAMKANLLARSRGGLMLYNWAAENHTKVNCIAGIYPVCDLRSYPGLARACGAYGLTEADLEKQLSIHNPVNRLEPLAMARVPILHIHGNVDKVVPLEENSAAIASQYKKLGGKMRLIVVPNQGHNMWRGFFECNELVEFIVANASGKLKPNGELR